MHWTGTVRLQIDYTPRQDTAAQQHYALCGVSKDSASGNEPSYPLPAQDVPLLVSETFSVVPPPQPAAAEPFSFHRNWRLPVFIQGEAAAAPIFIGVGLTAVSTPLLIHLKPHFSIDLSPCFRWHRSSPWSLTRAERALSWIWATRPSARCSPFDRTHSKPEP